MNIVGIILTILKLLRRALEWAHDRQLVRAGEARQAMKEAVKISEVARIAAGIDKDVDAMTDEEIDEAIDDMFRD